MDSLQYTLSANALFSASSGVVLLVGCGALDEALGLDTWFLALAGVSLIAYGALLASFARGAETRRGARLATVMDIAWVAGAALILVGYPSAMTTTGRVALLAVSFVVAGFAIAQLQRLRDLRGLVAS